MKTAFTFDSPLFLYVQLMLRTLAKTSESMLVNRDPERAAAAHLLRRTAMAVHPERVEQLAGRSWDDAVSQVLDDAKFDGNQAPATEHWTDTTDWWIKVMVGPNSGLIDRMAWFWHGLLTTNAYKVSDKQLLADQLDHLRTNAVGNYRSLLRGFVTGGALLEYLDANRSTASNPNENLARELMELFTIGRGHYNQDDVRAAARALAGWVVEDGNVEFRRENAFIAPLLYLGEQAEWDTDMVIDRLCDHPATAIRVSSRLWNHLVGLPLTEEAATELGGWWQSRDLEILPLVERILTDPNFAAYRMVRPRGALEWYCAARAPLDFGDDGWQLENMGQMPYLPPNVSGWPEGRSWLAPGPQLARAAFVHNVDIGAAFERSPRAAAARTTDQILDQCSLFDVTDETIASIERVAQSPEMTPESIQLVRWRLALTCPEFNLA